LRLVYTGGRDPMKGAGVLARAVTLLAGEPGWRLTTYGMDATADTIAGPQVERRPAFLPDRLDEVLAEADVLLVPSVMRESYSLVTREALLHGVPVVCSDSLGPEEVVRHDVNGLIVPAADADALAAAVRRLLHEPGLLPRLREATIDVPVRSLGEQVDGLEHRYSELRRTRRPRREPTVRRVLFVVGIEGAPLRYRVRLPAEGLALLGVESSVLHYRDPRIDSSAVDADAIVLYRVPATHQVLSLVNGLRERGTPVLFDVDDLIFDPDLAREIPALRILPPAEAEHWLEGVRRYRTTLEACDAFIGSTPALCRRVADLTGLPTEQFDNGVGVTLGQLSDAATSAPRRAGPLRIGYLSGTDTHEEDWAFVEPAVVDVLSRRPDDELWLAGKVTPSSAVDRLGTRVRRIPFTPWIKLPELLHDIDVNIAPLAPGSLFNEAKSAIKWLEAALVATPSIVSPTAPFEDAVDHDVNGLLARDLHEWSAALGELLDSEPTRQRLGRRARRDALLRWSPNLQGRRYLAILERASAGGGVARSRQESAFDGVALDEPAFERPFALEPYNLTEWRRWARRRRLEPVDPRRLASAARTTAARVRARLTRNTG
jgi:glycosyltransferase involved in cell wall biosynthesis